VTGWFFFRESDPPPGVTKPRYVQCLMTLVSLGWGWGLSVQWGHLYLDSPIKVKRVNLIATQIGYEKSKGKRWIKLIGA
jgi:hypothetical protein